MASGFPEENQNVYEGNALIDGDLMIDRLNDAVYARFDFCFARNAAEYTLDELQIRKDFRLNDASVPAVRTHHQRLPDLGISSEPAFNSSGYIFSVFGDNHVLIRPRI
ncbi:MAG: hypothetical protein ACLUFV_00560 [Acutalibacteraceae bacterium]